MNNVSFEKELNTYLKARFTLIILVTREEERALKAVKKVCEGAGRPCLTWDFADGFTVLAGTGGAPPPAGDPIIALDYIEKAEGNTLYVLKDFHEFWAPGGAGVKVKRKLRNLAQKLKFTQKSILVTTPGGKIPEELRDESFTVMFPSPDVDDLAEVLTPLTKIPGVKVNLTTLGRDKLLQAALGLSSAQAQRVFAKAIVSNGVLDDRDIDLVTQEKKEIIRESEALEFYSVTETPDDIGGLDVLKSWLRLRERAFTQEARNYGLPAPKGIALIGIPGTGKSLTAKMIGGLWHLPLLRLDVGSLFGSLVGESEERARRALRLAETVAPCIVWIDEMEKALAHGGSDSGTSTRVFGTILTWMQEKTAPCFVVATANDISSLPPELLRKGRFDDIFFLDLPTLEERKDIFKVHLMKRNRLPRDFNVDALARQSEGYVGAEIEQAVIDAMYVGYNEKREFTSDDVSEALKRQVPLSKSQRETIESLRAWLREGRAQSASFREVKEAEEQFVQIQVDGVY
jgi:AAA+ superfamily predicted ATPase